MWGNSHILTHKRTFVIDGSSELRTCSKCGVAKPLSEFYTDKRWNLPYAKCKKCQNSACKARGAVDVPITAKRASLFWTNVATSNEPGCWEWTGKRLKGDYGKANKLGKEQLAHRVAWMLVYGDIPPNIQVLHRCDNPPCVRPDHLFLGTQLDNMQDCVAKGRIASGTRNGKFTRPESVLRGSHAPRAKLTEDNIPTIRILLAAGVSERTIGSQFGVDNKTIHAIKVRQTWSHVP